MAFKYSFVIRDSNLLNSRLGSKQQYISKSHKETAQCIIFDFMAIKFEIRQPLAERR